MSSIAKSNISLSKKDLAKSRIPPVASRNTVFYHKATSGQLTINLLALTLPSTEMPTVSQATVAEISGANLTVNKKNLDLVSSSNGKLIQGLDYVIIDSYNISLIGPYDGVGADVDEIFVGTINSAPISDLVVASAKSVDKTYELAVGSTLLNLGREYQVGVNPNDNVGSIKVFVNGVLALRDIDYVEVDAGSGYGTTIQFMVAPVSIPHQIAVDFGVMAITDNNAIGAIENLAGSIQKIADDLAVVAGTTASDYYSASPSEIERRAFGDMILEHENKITEIYENEDPWLSNHIAALNSSTTIVNPRVAVLRHEAVSGSSGQTIGTSYTAKILNTLQDFSGIILNPTSFTGVSGGNTQFQLRAGLYRIQAAGVLGSGAGIGTGKLRLFNVTNSQVLLLGIGQYSQGLSGDDSTGTLTLNGTFEITTDSILELQQRHNVTRVAGYTLNFGDNEVFTHVEIEKIR
jgi:hypothetical protein